MMKVLEHEHPLKLIDLQVKDEDEEEFDEVGEGDVVVQDEFVCPCKRCDLQIHGYYMYYYTCINDTCGFSLHKFCAELPTTLKHTSDPHPLTLTQNVYPWRCSYCLSMHGPNEVRYTCFDQCYFHIDIRCAVELDKKRFHHPSHPHPLVLLINNPILCLCNACGKRHEGTFFQCITCHNFAIQTDCALLPKSLLIQQTTNDTFHHTHPLILSYSFPRGEQHAKYDPRCRVCNVNFFFSDQHLWIYKCEKCIYYTHLDCATSRREPFMSMLHQDRSKTVKNYNDADYPDLFHLPFPDQTYSMPRQLCFKEVDKVSLQHRSHHHELILVNTKCIDGASSSLCHNPMKKIELLCNACVRPIMEMPYYRCGANEDESCNFALHEWCTRLPTKVVNHPDHAQHPLVLMTEVPGVPFNIFYCYVCRLPCNGYAYGCVECDYYVDVTCGFIPEKITYKSHPNHLLLRVKDVPRGSGCTVCGIGFFSAFKLAFSCHLCDVYIHPMCALLLPGTIRHTYDKHPMKLSYLPIENHKSEYFCEICEYELNPHCGFYHCDECAQSVHSNCAPLILCCETETYSFNYSNIYQYINIKFGSIHKIHDHQHPLSFVQGIESDGQCSMCPKNLQYGMIFKCHKCKFAIHYECCRLKNNS